MLDVWAARPSSPIRQTSTQQKALFTPVNQPLTDAFHPGYQRSNEPFLCQDFQTIYNWATMALRGLRVLFCFISCYKH